MVRIGKSFNPAWARAQARKMYFTLMGRVNLEHLQFLRPIHSLSTYLKREIPGTYHHGVMVGSLAVAGAEEIGANLGLAWIIGVYHDIGKARKASFFAEALSGARNDKKSLTPAEQAAIFDHAEWSAGIIMSCGLPREVSIAVLEHHGTSEIYAESGSEIQAGKQLKHQGPIPSSRESAIVMLADQIDATFQRIKDKGDLPKYPSREYVRSIIEEISKGLEDAGQYKESGLSPKELDMVVGSMVWFMFRYFNGLDITRTPFPGEVKNPAMPHDIRRQVPRQPYLKRERRISP